MVARTVELFVDGDWLDVTAGSYVLAEDTITITRGVDARSSKASPGSLSLTLQDPTGVGRWSNRVPTSPNYRKLGRNTPIRVSSDGDVRCVMEIPKWDPRWELGDVKVRVPIKAAGILRRLNQGAKALRPALLRAELADSPVYCWPMSDGENATQAASALNGGKPMSVSGTPTMAAVTGPDGDQNRFPELVTDSASNGTFVATGLTLSSDGWTVEGWFRATKESVADAQTLVAVWHTTGGSFGAVDWLVYVSRIGSAEGIVLVTDHSDLSATSFSYNGSSVSVLDGEWHQFRVTANQDSASACTVKLWFDGVQRDQTTDSTHPTIGYPVDFTWGNASPLNSVYTLSNVASLSVAHLSMYSTSSAVDHFDAGGGYSGETAGNRFLRLCDENGVSGTVDGDADDTAAMGPQQIDTFINNLQACADADQGIMFETRTELGLTLRTRVSLYNQYGPLLDYTAGLIAPPLEPTEDDAFIQNDVTVNRINGSSARSVLETAVDPYHTLTTQAPPDGVGTYDRGPADLNLETDAQAPLVASWVRHLGTWDELRYPQLSVELSAPDWASNSELASTVAALDTGDQLRLGSLPAWLPPDEVALLVKGSVETIYPDSRRRFDWTLSPGWPWEVWQLDTGGSTLVAAIDSDDTSLKLATSVGPPWSTTDEPYFIQIGGDAMKVTAMSTDTPAFIAAGTIASGNNASVVPGLPAGMTPDVGQIMYLWAAIRSTSANPDLPAGWTSLAWVANARLMYKYYVTGDSAPTVTFTGGAAGDDTQARIFGFSGVSHVLDDGRYGATNPSPQTLSNGSAQNIAYPALSVRRNNCVVFYLGWKQDDWTSVATIAGATEDADNPTTTGNDQGIVVDHVIQTTATDIAAGSFTVTGGANAVSRGFTVALRPLQTATVTRDINNAATSHAAGDAVNGWRLGVVGL